MTTMIKSLLSSLRSRLIVLVLIAVFPGFFVTLFVANRQRQIAFSQVESQNRSILRLVAASQSQLVANTKTLMTTLAASGEIRSKNIEGCQTLLDIVLQSSIGYRGFAVSDANGKVWCRTANLRQATPISNTGAVTPTPSLQILIRVLDKKDFVIGDFIIGNVTGRPNLTFGYPVFDASKNLLAVITTGLDLDWLNKSIECCSSRHSASSYTDSK